MVYYFNIFFIMNMKVKFKDFKSWIKQLIANMLRLDRFFWKELKKYIIVMYSLMALDVIFMFVSRWSQAVIINYLTKIAQWFTIDQRTIIILSIVLIASLVLPSFINIFTWFFRLVIWRKIDEQLNISYMRKKASLDLAQLEDPSIFTLFLRVQENLWRFRNYFYAQFDLFYFAFNIVSSLIAILFVKPVIVLVILVFTMPEVISKFWLTKQVWTIDNIHWPAKKKYRYLWQLFYEQWSIIEMKLSWNVEFFLWKIKSIIDPFLKEQFGLDKKRAINSAITVLMSKLWIIISTFILIYAVYTKEIQIGTFVFIYGLLASFQSSLSYMFWFIIQQYEDNQYVDEYFKIQDMERQMTMLPTPDPLPIDSAPVIEFKNVSFRYPGKENEVLHKINFRIEPWEKVAVVWVNWAWKSTLIKLLTRFYDSESWSIKLSWSDIKNINIEEWWKMIWYMPQDSKPYFFEVRQSIAMWDTTKSIDMKKVEDAAKKSLAFDFISWFKRWFKQQLWKHFEDWEWLSGWQWQRLNLARIFYKNPKVYILDEPTSAMDAEAEASVFKTLSELPEDKTVIFISHRFSTIRQADKIIFLKDWKVSEIWTHEDLMKNSKTYKKMFDLQAKWYE